MDLPAAEQPEDGVAGLLDAQSPWHDVRMVPGHAHRVGIAQEVRGVQQKYVECVTLDPLAAVEEASQRTPWASHHHTGGALERVNRAHLIGNRTDAADSRGDVGRLGGRAASQEGFEEPRRLDDLQPHFLHGAVTDLDVQGALPFDAGEPVNADCS